MEKVNHPSHYNQGNIEVIDAIEDWDLGFDLGNAVKYIARAEHKGKEIEDLRKAKWYLEHRLMMLGCEETKLERDVLDSIVESPDKPVILDSARVYRNFKLYGGANHA